MCIGVDPETLVGTCVSFCGGNAASPTCPEPCDVCPVLADGLLVLCLPRCDALTQDCMPGWACLPFKGELLCLPDASPPDTEIGSPCQSVNSCPPGLVCMNNGSVPGCAGPLACCAPYCPLDAEDPCPELLPGTTCNPGFGHDDPPEGCTSASVGICILE